MEFKTKKLMLTDMLSLEDYDNQREQIKSQIIDNKKRRTVKIGENVVLLFENYETIKYQVQEMLRIEKIFQKESIQEEIDAYNPLIPDGKNLKATMLIMYPNVEERRIMLNKLHDIENKVWISVKDSKFFGIADEDLDRATENKTSAVHFLRFELNKKTIEEFQLSNEIKFGVDHQNYTHQTIISSEIKESLQKDFW
ncbi:MAG: hypothetical protein CMD65_01440 [Gammaproteobacteria bacterium]|nr:hypothetical protein [Gammaproteobacteria bacterium]